MDRLEEVKKILDEAYPTRYNLNTEQGKDAEEFKTNVGKRICQLFPKTKENPNGYEGK